MCRGMMCSELLNLAFSSPIGGMMKKDSHKDSPWPLASRLLTRRRIANADKLRCFDGGAMEEPATLSCSPRLSGSLAISGIVSRALCRFEEARGADGSPPPLHAFELS